MDTKFMEFWGNFLLNAAKSQKQLEDMTEWMRRGFTGFEELNSLFQKAYGLEKKEPASPDFMRAWAAAQEDFTNSFKDYLALLGMVSREEHLALARKYEELNEKVQSQEETIKHLRMLVSAASKDEIQGLAGRMEGLVQKQGEQFQKLMDNFSQFFKQESPS